MVEMILLLALIPGLILSRKGLRRVGVRGMVAVALIAALASGGRAVFAAIPSVQPASFLVLVCGMVLGPGPGFLCGAITAVLSSLFTSLGPWSAWQAMLWSLMGASGWLMNRMNPPVRALWGLAWGFVFGWVMNLWYYSLGLIPFAWSNYLAACVASFTMDLAHGVCNAVLLLTLSGGTSRVLLRLLREGSREREE